MSRAVQYSRAVLSRAELSIAVSAMEDINIPCGQMEKAEGSN
jgi:hypothetical protein